MSKIDINDVVEFICELDNDYKKLNRCTKYEDCDECPSENTCSVLMHLTFALRTVADARSIKESAKNEPK